MIVTTYNEERHISDLLDSLVPQEKIYEIIVVDSESEDRTREIVKEYAEKYDKIRLYVKRSTRGEGRNYGVEKAEGEYVAFIDADCIANPFWAEYLLKNAEKGEKVVAGKVINIGYGPFEKLERVELNIKGYDVTFPSNNLMYEKEFFQSIGGFDPWFITAEDIDLNYRAVHAGAKIVYEEKAIVYHRTRDSIYSFLRQAFWNGYGRKQLTLKHGPLWSKYPLKKLFNTQISFWGILRLISAFLGYMACKIRWKEYPGPIALDPTSLKRKKPNKRRWEVPEQLYEILLGSPFSGVSSPPLKRISPGFI